MDGFRHPTSWSLLQQASLLVSAEICIERFSEEIECTVSAACYGVRYQTLFVPLCKIPVHFKLVDEWFDYQTILKKSQCPQRNCKLNYNTIIPH